MHLPLDKKLILFVSQRVTQTIKGMDYMVEACNKLAADHPELKEQWGVVVMGGHADEIAEQFQLPVYPLGYVNNTRAIVQAYQAADVFVIPSLSDNLPNTIMEALACGVPCVGFNVGGIPEMIDHQKNGYVAKYRSADDLAAGIYWTLHEADHQQLSREAVNKVERNYSQQSVAVKYIEVYTNAIAQRTFRI
jgi:glycosyltransferase involved in cell wall biosynthesis